MSVCLTDQQQAVVDAPGSVVVTAGAGSGKTELLAERFIAHLRVHGLRPLQVVAVTFTDAAALELRGRIRDNLARECPDAGDWLAEVQAAPIGTFHSLCARICREHPAELGSPVAFRVMDAGENEVWLSDHLDDVLSAVGDEYFAGDDALPFSVAAKALRRLVGEPVLANDSLKRATEPDALARWKADSEASYQEQLRQTVGSPEWHEDVRTLQNDPGAPGDKLKPAHDVALAVGQHFVENPSRYANAFDGVNLRGGSAKVWHDATTMKDAVRRIHDSVDEVMAKANAFNPEIDGQAYRRLCKLARLFNEVQVRLSALKKEDGVLAFGDLEAGALCALADPDVKAWYGDRWRAFIVDECQDINPVQGDLIRDLANCTAGPGGAAPIVTLVGDAKQSIYGFRGARPDVFDQLGDELVVGKLGGVKRTLTESFRTHAPLVRLFNVAFPELIGADEQLTAHRADPPCAGPFVELITVETNKDKDDKSDQDNHDGKKDAKDKDKTGRISVELIRRQQARLVADRLKTWFDGSQSFEVWDKRSGATHPVSPRDVAIIGRAWDGLQPYVDALSAAGIPVVDRGGGNLLDTRPAKDAAALLTFLAVPEDNLALAAVLRSPWFAVDDPTLLACARAAQSCAQDQSDSTDQTDREASWRPFPIDLPQLEAPGRVLDELLAQRGKLPPTELLAIADGLTGYSATLANLPTGDRLLADWHGFFSQVAKLEAGCADVFTVVRRLRRLVRDKVALSRPTLQAENAVTTISIHSAKGLEWPVVILVDLNRVANSQAGDVEFDPEIGVALKMPKRGDTEESTWLGNQLKEQRAAREKAEDERLLYVALTRARDRVLLLASGGKGGLWEALTPGLPALGFADGAAGRPRLTARKQVDFNLAAATLAAPTLPPAPTPPDASHCHFQRLTPTIDALPVSALREIAACPKRYEYRYVRGFADAPQWRVDGVGEDGGGSHAAHLGTIVHSILEHGWTTLEQVQRAWLTTSVAILLDALQLADNFRDSDVFAAVRNPEDRREVPIAYTVAGVTFTGRADLVGKDYVLDYKTGKETALEAYYPQIWLYAAALGKTSAYLADLRHIKLDERSGDDLAVDEQQVKTLALQLYRGPWPANPSDDHCRFCPVRAICPDSVAKNT